MWVKLATPELIATTFEQEVVKEGIDEHTPHSFKDDPADPKFAEMNIPNSECHKKLMFFLKESNIEKDYLDGKSLDKMVVTIHSTEELKEDNLDLVRIHLNNTNTDIWLTLEFNNLLMNTEDAQPIWFDAKLLHELIASCFPNKIPTDEYYRYSKKEENWTTEFYGADYYSASRIYEFTSPFGLKEAYQQLIHSGVVQHLLLLNIPSQDYDETDKDSAQLQYKLKPNLYIQYTHPSGASDHYYFTTDENGTKIRMEVECN